MGAVILGLRVCEAKLPPGRLGAQGVVAVTTPSYTRLVIALSAARARHARVHMLTRRSQRLMHLLSPLPPEGSHICPGNLRLDPHIAPRRALLLPMT
jgi:hypothetical protein